MSETIEEWRVIDDAPDYAVSDRGRVKRIVPDWQGKYDGRILKPSTHRSGYLAHVLCTPSGKITRKVHRLVCQAWHGPSPSPKHHAAHYDGQNQNNTPDNLYWATARENVLDKKRHGTFKIPENRACGDNNWTRKYPERVLRGDKHPRRLRPEIVPRGADANNAKLTEEQARAIIAAPQYHGVGRDLAKRYGVTMGLITAIRKGRAWAHLPRPI